jgi:hypothetical protein
VRMEKGRQSVLCGGRQHFHLLLLHLANEENQGAS